MGRKVQVTAEFLLAYGWVILAAIVTIGVLAYFGVFSPGKNMTGNAIIDSPFYIEEANAKESYGLNGGVQLLIKNNGEENYNIQSVTISNCGIQKNLQHQIGLDDTMEIIIECDNEHPLLEGESIKGDISITYQKEEIGINLISTGKISKRII
ncbi:MAG: hypothetical protein WC548_00145 [Candidatus Pacearchaeota archaeon]